MGYEGDNKELLAHLKEEFREPGQAAVDFLVTASGDDDVEMDQGTDRGYPRLSREIEMPSEKSGTGRDRRVKREWADAHLDTTTQRLYLVD